MKKIITFLLILIVIKGLCQAQTHYLITNFDVVRYYSGDSLILKTTNDSISEFEWDGVMNGDTVEDCNGVFIKYLDAFDQRVILNKNHRRLLTKRVPAIYYSEDVDFKDYKNEMIMSWKKTFKLKRKLGTISLFLPAESLKSTIQNKMMIEIQVDCRFIQFERY